MLQKREKSNQRKFNILFIGNKPQVLKYQEATNQKIKQSSLLSTSTHLPTLLLALPSISKVGASMATI